MLIRPGILGNIYDYAITLGMYDAADNIPMRENLFRVPLIESQEARFLYELAYELEKESGVIAATSDYSIKAFIRKWDSCHGQGLLETVINGRCKYMQFDYTILEQDIDLELGEIVTVVYSMDESYNLTVKSIKTHGAIYEQQAAGT